MLLASAVSKHAGIERGSTADFRFVDDLQWSPLCTIGRTTTAIVLVIDDDADVREGLRALLESVGLRSNSFKCAPEFFRYELPDKVCCLIVDVRLPGLSGLEFQTELAEVQIDIPIIFITGYGDISMSVKAMRAGAVEFLTKPLREQELLDAVQVGLDRNRQRREHNRDRKSVV